MSRDRNRRTQLTSKELKGFTQLLCSTSGLPEPTDDILAYVERIGSQLRPEPRTAREIAAKVIHAITVARLHEARVEPIRAFDMHLRAKRSAARCTPAHVASALGIEVRDYEGLESGVRNPLDESAAVLAGVVRVFGLHIAELRGALIGYLLRGTPRTELGFARGVEGKVSKDELAIAADDLRHGAAQKKAAGNRIVEQVERKLDAVQAALLV